MQAGGTFAYLLINEAGLSDTGKVIIINEISVNINKNIKVNYNINKYKNIYICTLNGKIIRKFSNTSINNINTDMISAGMYIINIPNILSKKLIIK